MASLELKDKVERIMHESRKSVATVAEAIEALEGEYSPSAIDEAQGWLVDELERAPSDNIRAVIVFEGLAERLGSSAKTRTRMLGVTEGVLATLGNPYAMILVSEREQVAKALVRMPWIREAYGERLREFFSTSVIDANVLRTLGVPDEEVFNRVAEYVARTDATIATEKPRMFGVALPKAAVRLWKSQANSIVWENAFFDVERDFVVTEAMRSRDANGARIAERMTRRDRAQDEHYDPMKKFDGVGKKRQVRGA